MSEFSYISRIIPWNKKLLVVKKSLKLWKISQFSFISRTNPWNKIVLGSLKKIYKETQMYVTYYVLYNNFFYTQLILFLFLRKIFVIFTIILKLFFRPFSPFVFFFFRMIFISFTCFFLESFFILIAICHVY